MVLRIVSAMHPDPWRWLAEHWPHVRVEREPLAGKWAEVRWMMSGRVILVLDKHLNQVERRVCVAHETRHLERGAPCGSLRSWDELKVRAATARWLIPDLDVLAETVAVYDLHQAADHLWVTFPVLVDRLNGLTNDESDYVHERRGREHVA